MLTVSLPEEANLPQAERAIASGGLSFRFVESSETWEPAAREDVHIDLSAVRFIHLSALAEIAIVALETVSADGGLIRVTMPQDDLARRFIVSADFLPALRLCPYREGVRVQSDGTSPPAESFDQLFPLRWIDNSQKAQFDDWLEHVFGLSAKRTIGLITDDAEALSRLILDELLDNVVRHSGRSHALVSAWTQRRPRNISSAGYLPTEVRAFAEARSSTLAATHLVVADAGCGIAHSLRGYKKFDGSDLVAHAFDRWSSSGGDVTSNGTRGLYRVALLTNDHLGITTLRSGSHVASHIPSTFTSGRPERADSSVIYPGTLLRVEIPMPAVRRVSAAPPAGRVEPLQLKRLTAGDLATRDSLRTALSARRNTDGILVADLSQAEIKPKDVQDVITQIAALAHPGLTAVGGLNLENLKLRAAAEGVMHVARTSDEEALVPVLCFGSDFKESWWAPQGEGHQLLEQADSDPADEPWLADAGFSTNLIREGQVTRLRLTPASLTASAQAHIDNRIAEHLVRPKHGYFLTSSLRAVGGWIDLDTMHATYPEEISLIVALLVTKLRAAHPSVVAQRPHLIYEWGVDEELARRVARALQGGKPLHASHSQRLRQRDMDAKAALGLPRDRPIAILVQGVSAAQSAARLIAHAVRQGYRVECVMTVVDTRATSVPIDLWSQQYPVVSATRMSLAVDNPTGKAQVVGEQRPRPTTAGTKYPCATSRLVAHLDAAEAVFVGHYSGSRDRHFTFYIDPQHLLAHEPFKGEVLHWVAAELNHRSDQDTFVIAITEDGDEPALDLAADIASTIGRRRAVRLESFAKKHLGKNPVDTRHLLIAWGSMTAVSLLVAIDRLAAHGIRSLRVFVVLDQLTTDMSRHLGALRSVQGRDGDMTVSVEFFTRAPLSAYPQQSCPMCLQAASDGRQDVRLPVRAEYDRQRDRLALRPWQSGAQSGSADPLCEQYGGTSTRLIAEALSRRIELTRAAASPIEGHAWVRALPQNGLREAYLLSLSTLIVYEPDWLTRSPMGTAVAREVFSAQLRTFLVPPAQAVIREQHENARALIALRLTSKSAFVEALPELVRTFSDRPEFRLVRHLVWTIYTREHLAGSGLIRRLAEALDKSLSWCNLNRGSQATTSALEELLRETESRSMSRVDDVSTLSLAYRARAVAGSLARHDVQSAYRSTSIEVSHDDPAAHLDAWDRLLARVARELDPLIPHLRDRYLLTTQFRRDPDLFMAFFPQATKGVLQRVVSMLEGAVQRGDTLTDDEIDELRRARGQYTGLFVRRTPDRLSLFEEATDNLFFTAGIIWEMLERKAQTHANVTVRQRLSPTDELLDIALPGRYLAELLDAVLENTSQRVAVASKPAQLEFRASRSLEPDRESCILTFTSEGVLVNDEPRTKLEPGHLDLLQSRAPVGVAVEPTIRNASSNTFELTVAIAGLRHQ